MFVLDEEGPEGRVVKGIAVTIKTVGDNGVVTKTPITLDYKILPTNVSDEIIAAAQEGDTDADLVKATVVGWGLVRNRAGDLVDFSAEALKVASKKANFRSAALEGYFKTAAGEKPRKGN